MYMCECVYWYVRVCVSLLIKLLFTPLFALLSMHLLNVYSALSYSLSLLLSLSRIYVYKTMLISFNFFLHVVLVVLGKQLTVFSWKSLPKNMHNYHKRSRYYEKIAKLLENEKKQQHYLHKPLENK